MLVAMRAIALAAAAVTALAFAAQASAATILRTARLGNAAEGATLITSGRHANEIAVLDGYDVLAVPVEGRGRDDVEKLFDVKSVPPVAHYTGIGYLQSQHVFVLEDVAQPQTLFRFNEHGAPLSPVQIQEPGEPDPSDSPEGLVQLPPDAPAFAGDLVRAVTSFFTGPRLEVVDPSSGAIIAEIPSQLPPDFFYWTGVAYSHGHLLVTAADENVWTLDFSGAVLAGPTAVPGVHDLENIVGLRDGRVAVSDYPTGTFQFLGSTDTRSYRIGPGISLLSALAWDPSGLRLIALGINRQTEGTVSAVSPLLFAATTLFTLPDVFDSSLAYLPNRRQIAIARAQPAPGVSEVRLYDVGGHQVGDIPFNVPGPLTKLRPELLAYDTATHELLVRAGGASRISTIYFVSLAGALDRTLAVAPALVGGLAYDAHHNRIVVSDPGTSAFESIDPTTGAIIASTPASASGLLQPSAIAWASFGPFDVLAAGDRNSNEVSLVSLP